MADKQVNININYKVNTVEVEKAQALVQRAQNTTNQFQQSAQQAGKGTEAAFKAAGASLETLNGKLLSLKDRINQSSDPKKIAQLSEQYKKLKTQVDDLNKSAFQTPKAIKETGAATQSLAGQLGGLYSAAKLAFTGGIIAGVVSTTLELAKLSGNVEGVERAFDRAFPNAAFLLDKLKKATHGTVTEFELMQRTLQATNLGVSVDELGVLFEFAAARAQQTGESVDYLVDSIVRGIGRKSILVLDNLGLSATRLKEQFNGASLASQSVADVTKGVAAIAKVELDKMGGYAETAATKVGKLTAGLQELKIEAAKKVESGFFISLANDAVEGLKILLKGEQQIAKEEAKLAAGKQVDNFINDKAFKDLKDNQTQQIDLITKEIIERQRLIRVRESEIEANKKAIQERINDPLEFDLPGSTQGFKDQIAAQTESKAILEASIPIFKNYLTQLRTQGLLEKEQLGIIEQLQEDISKLGDKIKGATSVDDIERFNRELVVLEARLKELNELGKTFVNPLASATFDIKDKLSKGKVKLKPGDIISTEELQADTQKLFNDLGKKAAEQFKLGVKGDIDNLDRIFFQVKEQLLTSAIDISANLLTDLANVEVENYQGRIRALRSFYDEQQILAGDNERAKKELQLKEKTQTDKLRKEEAEKEKKARIFSIIVNTAAGIAKAFATSATIYDAYVNAAIVALQGAEQLAIAKKANPGFKDGVLNLNGKGTGTSDSIPARLSKGESVMTAQEWKTSKNVLKEVRAKRLDDDVLQSLKLGNDGVKVVGGMDDKRMIAKLDEIKNSMPDVEARGHLLYTTKKKADNYRMWVRKSSMSE